MTYLNRIRFLRETKGLNQTQVASILKVGQKTYSDYELGKTRIPVDSLIILAEYYDVSMDYICGVSDKMGGFCRK